MYCTAPLSPRKGRLRSFAMMMMMMMMISDLLTFFTDLKVFSDDVRFVCVDPTVTCDDSDSSSSASTSYQTPASVAAFVKKVKRIRFNSITIAKDLPSTRRVVTPRPAMARTTSCPGLVPVAADVGTPTSVSSSQHLLAASSPASSLRPVFDTEYSSSPLTVDRISVATQTVMYVNSSESDVVVQVAPYESLVAQTVPFAPFVQCYACLHGRQPTDDSVGKPGLLIHCFHLCLNAGYFFRELCKLVEQNT